MNTVQILKARMPIDHKKPQGAQVGGRDTKKDKIVIDHEINHQGEVNKARYMPQSHNLVATKTISAEV